jgi:hypothetical protein
LSKEAGLFELFLKLGCTFGFTLEREARG